MKKIFTTITFLLAIRWTQAQSTSPPLSPHYMDIAVYSRHFTDAFSGTMNQAALANCTKATAAIYGERRFMLKELSNYAGAVSFPSRLGGFGIALNFLGAENFSNSRLGLGYGKKLGNKIDIGIQFNYHSIRIPGYGSSNSISFEAGTIMHLTDKLHMGLHVFNPAGGKFGKMNSEKLAFKYTGGFGYELSDKVFVSAVIKKEEDKPAAINTGMQYNFATHFFSRIGVITTTGHYFFGLGLQWKTIRVDAISSWQGQLGFTPGIMLLFDFKEDKETPVLEN